MQPIKRERSDLLAGLDDTRNGPQNLLQSTAEVQGKNWLRALKLNGKCEMVKMTWKILI